MRTACGQRVTWILAVVFALTGLGFARDAAGCESPSYRTAPDRDPEERGVVEQVAVGDDDGDDDFLGGDDDCAIIGATPIAERFDVAWDAPPSSTREHAFFLRGHVRGRAPPSSTDAPDLKS